MNLFADAPPLFLVVLAGLVALAAAEDAWRMRISNIVILAIIALAIGAFVAVSVELDIWQNLLNVAVVLVIGTAIFSAGKMGGGDVKLLAALALWADWKTGLWLVSAIFIAGGAVALLLLLRRMLMRSRQVAYRDMRIAYGVPIAIGALAIIGVQRLGAL